VEASRDPERASWAGLLQTYNLEREKVAADLIDFDRSFSKLFFAHDITPQHFSEQFVKSGQYTAGFTKTYADSCIRTSKDSAQSLAKNLVVGMRFPSVQIVRLCDARAMQLVKARPADGRWRIVIAAGDIRDSAAAERLQKVWHAGKHHISISGPLIRLGDHNSLPNSPSGPIRTFTPAASAIDSFIEPLVLLSGPRHQIEQERIPDIFWPATGKWGIRGACCIVLVIQTHLSGY
jgi:phenol 2-monooxygenase (NADPH)